MISLDDMMVFTKVVETQSFTKAAEQLGVGKARVSQIVTKLEQGLNTRLLHRTTRSLSLTDTGVQYYKKCQMIQELAMQANTDAQTFSNEPSGLIRISVPIGNAAYLNLFSQFLGQYPQIQLDVVESDSYS
ncbi:LysR family transcriptional regulator, partial [Photobacterium sp. OFAV2-7]|uniref:LysR family transcriptional regulator n=1 Tax=Photobacterium sp. OFAV2-7 TaxID=2917748 RepID=UPI001EF3D61D